MQFRHGRVLGAFELRIDVKANDPIIREDRDKLALFRYLASVRPANDYWRPIFERWAATTAARLPGVRRRRRSGGDSRIAVRCAPDEGPRMRLSRLAVRSLSMSDRFDQRS
jgi:hypothetical protein